MKRISDKIFEETKSLEDLVQLMAYDKDGCSNAEIGNPTHFLNRYQMYKEKLKKDLPEFTFEEILKFSKYFHELKDSIFCWGSFDSYLTCLEYEERDLAKENVKYNEIMTVIEPILKEQM